jgi:hypothetical protein
VSDTQREGQEDALFPPRRSSRGALAQGDWVALTTDPRRHVLAQSLKLVTEMLDEVFELRDAVFELGDVVAMVDDNCFF